MKHILLVLAMAGTTWGQERLELRPVRDLADDAGFSTFSSDGKRVLAFLRKDSMAVFDADGGKEILSVPASPMMNDLMDSYLRPECFSPDGARVLIQSRMPDRPPDQWGGALQLLVEAGKKPVEIRGDRSSSWFGTWSLDGKHVYFIDGGHRKEPGYSLRRWSVETGRSEKIHESGERLACGLRRSHDGEMLAYCDWTVADQKVRVVILDLKSGKVLESDPFPVDDAGADGIRVIHWEPEGQSILFNRSPDTPRKPGMRERLEVWRFEIDGRKVAPFLEGKTLEGMLLAPAGKDRFFAATMDKGRASYCVLDRKGGRFDLPAGVIGIASAGDHWLTLEPRTGKLSIVRPVWILK